MLLQKATNNDAMCQLVSFLKWNTTHAHVSPSSTSLLFVLVVMTELSVALMYPEVQRAREQQRTYQMEQRFTNAVEKSLQQIFVEAEQLTLM